MVVAAAMNDHRVPDSVSRCLLAAFVSFRGCFQFITGSYAPDTKKCSYSDYF